MSEIKYPNIFSPIRIGNVTFRNRIWSAPAGVHLLQGREIYPNEHSCAYYFAKARGGAACITYSAMNMDVDMPYDGIHACENILKEESHRFFSEFTSGIHSCGAKVSLELLAFTHHGFDKDGNRISYSVNGGWDEDEETTAFTREELERLAKRYGDVAEAAVACGFDMILIHSGHGLYLSQFLSKELNKRTDEFGGSLENRTRFINMILDEIRGRVGNKLLIEVRISGDELFGEGGNHVEDCIEILENIQDKIDLAHVSNGSFMSDTENITHPTEFLEEGCNAYLAKAVKQSGRIHIPVLTLGAFSSPDKIEQVLANGEADIVAMARGLIADADRVNKWREGREDECIPCIRCFNCLNYRISPIFSCSVNPTVGRESRLPYMHSECSSPKKVAIIGGGPAGMQAAITAASRGHEVTLYEKSDRLGGMLTFSEQVSFKQPLADFMHYLIGMTNKHANVRLNTTATPDLLANENYDVIISAIGATALMPPISGIDMAHVITAEQAYALDSSVELGNIVVIGGGLVGCETGLHFAKDRGYKGRVTILEMTDAIAADEMYLTRDALIDNLDEYAAYNTGACVNSIAAGEVSYTDKAGATHSISADTVIVAAGMVPRAEESLSFYGVSPRVIEVGDCTRAANVRLATRSGYDAAMMI